MTNTITEMKNMLEDINSRLDKAENQISDLEDKVAEHTIRSKKKKKKFSTNEDSLRELWYNMKHNNTCIIGVPHQTEKRVSKGMRNYLKI